MFQSLFYWIALKKSWPVEAPQLETKVSILVLLDSAQKVDFYFLTDHNVGGFQSLFYWIALKKFQNADLSSIDTLGFQSLFYWIALKK